MMIVLRRAVPLLTIAVMVGCSKGPQVHLPHASPPPASQLVASYAADAPTETRAPTGQITLRDAIEAALTSSPTLLAYSFELRAKELESLQAKRRPNPELGFGIENFAGSGEFSGLAGSETTLALSQLIELGGKRQKRHSVAKSALTLSEWDYEITRLDVLDRTARTFLHVLAAQRQLELSRELSEIAVQTLTSVSRRVRAGSTSQVEEHLARVQVETTGIEISQAERALAAARTLLSLNWGSAKTTFTEALGDLETVNEPPPLQSLLDRVEQNPALARFNAELTHRRASVELERSLGRPDLSVGGGLRFFSGSDDAAFVLELGLPLPIFDRNESQVEAATMRVRRAEGDRRTATVTVLNQISVSHDALLAAKSEVKAIRDRALPEANTAFDLAQQAYSRGSIPFTFVLDTERQLFELRGRYFDALVRYHTAVADLERLTGAPITNTSEDFRGTQR